MQKLIPLLILLPLLASAAFCAPVRVASVYSQFLDYQYKSDQTEALTALGWQEDIYENIKISELVQNINKYDLIVLNATYNYMNTQDLTEYAGPIREYVRRGGCIVVTDANYPQMTEWLTSIDPRLVWVPSEKLSNAEGARLPWSNKDHPLIAGLDNPMGTWTYPSQVSPYLVPLYRYSNGATAAGVMELGKGAVVVSTLYHQTGWPTAGFFSNLINWIRDSGRLENVRKRQEEADKVFALLPELTVPLVESGPIIDGLAGDKAWEKAALINAFYDKFGRSDISQATSCRVLRTKHNLYVFFDCTENYPELTEKGITGREGETWLNDSVELFLDPTNQRKSYCQFAVGCSGAMYDGVGWNSLRDFYWEAKTAITATGWSAEIRIPLAALGQEALTSSGTWAANFNRFSRPSGLKELLGWSPVTAATFHEAERFGIIKGMSVDAADYPFATDLILKTPEKWYAGDNKIIATPRNTSKRPSSGVLELIDIADNKVLQSTNVNLAPNQSRNVSIGFPASPGQVRLLQCVLRDSKEGYVLAGSEIIKVETAPILDLQVALPVVRGSVQSKDKIKKLVVNATVGYDSSELLTLECIGKRGDKTIASQLSKIRSRKTITMSTDLSKLAPGSYEFVYNLKHRDQVVASKSMPLTIAKPAETEVSFDSKGVCYVNGKPFFPIGLYHVTKAAVSMINERSRNVGLPDIDLYDAITQIKARGFNTLIHSWGMPDDEYMKFTESLGLWVIPELPSPTKEQVDMANRYSNVLMWYGADEPSGERLQMIRDARSRTAQLDPDRPVSAAVVNPNLFAKALEGFDFLMMDPYVIRHAPLSVISDWIKKGRAVSGESRPIWLVPQAFTCDSPLWKEPTPEELRCQAYIGLVNGAKAFLWYAYFTAEDWADNPKGRGYWVLSDSKLWDAFPKLNEEVNELAPIVLTGRKIGPVECSAQDVQTCLWRYQGKSYLLAVNTKYTPIRCSMKTGEKTAQVQFEGRTVTAGNGSITDDFKPLEAHVYVF